MKDEFGVETEPLAASIEASLKRLAAAEARADAKNYLDDDA